MWLMQISWFRNDYNISKQKKMEASQIQKVKQDYQSDRYKAISYWILYFYGSNNHKSIEKFFTLGDPMMRRKL